MVRSLFIKDIVLLRSKTGFKNQIERYGERLCHIELLLMSRTGTEEKDHEEMDMDTIGKYITTVSIFDNQASGIGLDLKTCQI